MEVRFLLFHKDSEIGSLSFLMLTFQMDGFQVLEKECFTTFLGYKTGRRLEEKKVFKIASFLK